MRYLHLLLLFEEVTTTYIVYYYSYYKQRLKSKNRSLIGLTTLGIGILVSDNVDHPPPPPNGV